MKTSRALLAIAALLTFSVGACARVPSDDVAPRSVRLEQADDDTLRLPGSDIALDEVPDLRVTREVAGVRTKRRLSGRLCGRSEGRRKQ